jgi:hypothetical protein
MAFPNNPSIGDTHTEFNTLWTYGNTGWYRTTIGIDNETLYTCGPSLGSLNDVDLTPPPSDGDALVYDQASDSWIPGAAGATPGGLDTQIQFNDGGTALGGDADLTWNKNTNLLTVGGDVNLNDGGSFTTTLQTVTPTANRTISFPNATGTVGLVGGSSGQLVFNDAGAYAGVSTATVSSGDITLTGRLINSTAGALSASPVRLNGTWLVSGGANNTTFPQLYVSPSTASTGTSWSTTGTGLGINAPASFTGDLAHLLINGTSEWRWSNTTFTIADANDIAVGTTTGTKIGTATTQKLGFWNVAPVIQPASADQAALGAVTTVGTNTGTPGAGLSLIGDTSTTDQSAALMNDLAALREDLAAAYTLINQLRTNLVAVGLIKGAA